MKIRTSPLSRILIVMAISASLAGISACSSYSNTPPAPAPSPTPAPNAGSVNIDLTARSITFDKDTITVPAGARVTITFSNQDSGIPHNFALYTDTSAKTSIFKGEVISGPATTTYNFTAPATPGNYFFRCDIHSAMNGAFVVTAP